MVYDEFIVINTGPELFSPVEQNLDYKATIFCITTLILHRNTQNTENFTVFDPLHELRSPTRSTDKARTFFNYFEKMH